jgi:hypothetical protein
MLRVSRWCLCKQIVLVLRLRHGFAGHVVVVLVLKWKPSRFDLSLFFEPKWKPSRFDLSLFFEPFLRSFSMNLDGSASRSSFGNRLLKRVYPF